MTQESIDHYLFIYDLFKDAISRSFYVALSDRMTSE
jgi:hypothetical protein